MAGQRLVMPRSPQLGLAGFIRPSQDPDGHPMASGRLPCPAEKLQWLAPIAQLRHACATAVIALSPGNQFLLRGFASATVAAPAASRDARRPLPSSAWRFTLRLALAVPLKSPWGTQNQRQLACGRKLPPPWAMRNLAIQPSQRHLARSPSVCRPPMVSAIVTTPSFAPPLGVDRPVAAQPSARTARLAGESPKASG